MRRNIILAAILAAFWLAMLAVWVLVTYGPRFGWLALYALTAVVTGG